MGGPAYNFQSRSSRTVEYKSKSFTDKFEQNKKGEMHESMDPKKALIRESRDSDIHPFTLPVIFGMDFTGSMQKIPEHLIEDGLPDMIKKIMERGIKSPAILFLGIGDSKWDKVPLQVGQFESGDKELDIWLERSYIEGNGGGNGGESYLWAWYYAAKHCVTDAWEKRGQKGIIITVGNEPCHSEITSAEFRDVMGLDLLTMTMQQIYDLAKEKWNIYHICINNRFDACPSWKEFLGENAISVTDYRDVPNVAADIVAKSIVEPPTVGTHGPEVKITL